MHRGLRRALTATVVTALGTATAQAMLTAGPASAATTGATVRVVSSSSTCSSFFCFKPPLVKIANNNQVTWINQSGVTHTITRCTPAQCSGHGGGTGTDVGFGRSSLGGGQQYSFLFDAPGTYVYYCAIHGYGVMHGTVSVH